MQIKENNKKILDPSPTPPDPCGNNVNFTINKINYAMEPLKDDNPPAGPVGSECLKDDSKLQQLCDDGGSSQNFWTELGSSTLGVLGWGGLAQDAGLQTSLDKLHDEADCLNGALQDLSNAMSQNYAKANNALLNCLQTELPQLQDELNAVITKNTTYLKDKITTNSIFIGALWTITILLLFFILDKPSQTQPTSPSKK